MGAGLKRGALVLFITLVFFGCDRTPPAPGPAASSGRQIKIGVIGPFSGEAAVKGESGLNGLKTFLKSHPLLNNGDEIKVVVHDDGNNSRLTVGAFKHLVQKEKVASVLLLSTSSPVLEINQIADQYGTPVLALIASHPEIAVNTRYVSQLCFDDSFQGKVAAFFIRDDLFLSKVAVFEDIDSSHSLSLSTVFREQFLKIGGGITDLIPVSIKTEEMAAKISALRAQGTEGLYLPVDAGHFIRISKALKAADWHPVRMGGDGLFASAPADHGKDLGLLEGTLSIEAYSPDAKWVAFGRRLFKRELRPDSGFWNTYAMAGAEGIALVVNAMNRCDDPSNRESLNRQLRNTRDFEGFMGKLSIQDDGKALRPLIINTIKNGTPKFHLRVH